MTGSSYENFADVLPSPAGVLNAADMSRIPDPSTLWKFSLSNISGHMEKRVKEFGICKEKKDFVKTTYSVDTDSLMILSCGCADRHSRDVKRMEYAGCQVLSEADSR
jgi:hypothetical protein